MSWWEETKKRIKMFSIAYSTWRGRASKEVFKKLQDKIAGIEAQRNNNKNGEVSEKLNVLLKKQEDLFQKRAKTRMFKLMQEEHMGQEKCLAYFFAQMKRREEKRTIMELESGYWVGQLIEGG